MHSNVHIRQEIFILECNIYSFINIFNNNKEKIYLVITNIWRSHGKVMDSLISPATDKGGSSFWSLYTHIQLYLSPLVN